MKTKRTLAALIVVGVMALGGALYARNRFINSPEYKLKLAMKHPGVKQLDEEVGALQREVAANPKSVDARWKLADKYQKIGLMDLAEKEIEEITRLDPSSRDAAQALGDVRVALKKPKEAREAYETVIKKWPKWPGGYQGMAALRFHQQRYREAADYSQKALDLDPKNPALRYVLATTLVRFVEQFPTRTPYAPDLHEAARLLNLVLPEWHEPGDVHFTLGRTYAMMRDSKKAIVHLTKALELQPDRVEVAAELVDTYKLAGSRVKALELADKSVARGMKSARLFDLQGQLVQQSSDPKAAEKAYAAFQEAVKLNPENAAYQGHLGGACVRLNKLEEARKAFEQAAVLDPEDAYAYQQLSGVYTRLGDIKRAGAAARMARQMVSNDQRLRRFEQLSAADPGHLGLQLILADRYRDLGLRSAAYDKYSLVLSVDPNNKKAKEGIAALEKPADVASTK